MKQGDFIWYELMTSDPVAAADFYGKVVGWTMKGAGLPGIDYTLACLGDRQLAGIMTLPDDQRPPRPVWIGYIAVDDVDAKSKEVEAAGGSIHRTPEDIPGVGRFAMVSDPQGAVFCLFKDHGEPMESLPMMKTGSVGWHELNTTDWQSAWDFYSAQFGWTKDVAYDMGAMGAYQLFKTSGDPVGGLMTDTSTPHPYWLFYFVVDDIDDGLERVKSNGGQIQNGPMEVPGGAWVAQCADPQGGVFAIVGMRKSA